MTSSDQYDVLIKVAFKIPSKQISIVELEKFSRSQYFLQMINVVIWLNDYIYFTYHLNDKQHSGDYICQSEYGGHRTDE